MLIHDLYLKNCATDGGEITKNVGPIKKVFVKINDDGEVVAKLDLKTLEHYGVNVEQVSLLQDLLAMPSNNLTSVGLPDKRTGANSKMPYVDFFGKYEKNKLMISITGKSEGQKETYEFVCDFVGGKEPVVSTPVDSLFLRLDDKCYFVGEKLLFSAYRDSGIITSDGALSSKVFKAVCSEFFSFWNKKIVFEELKKFTRFNFRIVVLPFSFSPDDIVEYRSQEEAIVGETFEDCFGNTATDYPSTPTVTVKFLSFDDEAFTTNCKTKKEFYKNLGIGNESFDKISLPTDRINIAGLEWYFFELNNSSIDLVNGAGIYDKLFNNYLLLSKRSEGSVRKQSTLKIMCTKRAQAKLEVLIDENLTLGQMKDMFSRAQDELKHPMALESLIVKTDRDIVWPDYITAVRYFMNGAYFDRSVLVQRCTRILRDKLRTWLKSVISIKKEADEFFEQTMFCLKILTKKESALNMNKNEEYAYKIGIIAGKYVKFKRENDEVNNSTQDILTYSKYDRERLQFVYKRVGLGISLSKINTDVLSTSRQRRTKSCN